MGNILRGRFYNTGNIWPYLQRSLSSLLLFPTLQQSQEWLSRPCKGVCVCVFEREREREREMKQAHLHRSSWRVPVRVGDSGRGRQPSQSEGTNLTQALSNTKANKNSRLFCEEISCSNFVHLDAFIGERPRLHLWLSLATWSVFILESCVLFCFSWAIVAFFLFFCVCNS